MGGNALKNTHTRRYNKDEYNHLTTEILDKLTKILPNRRINVIPSYFQKETFGDMDILIESNNIPSDWINLINKEFTPNEYYKNGEVLSFDYKEFQIDLILSPSKEYDFAFKYYSYNDLGNFIGRIAHKLGLKFGHKGLDYVVRDGSYVIADLNVTQDFEEALQFMDYDVSRYKQGFETVEGIYLYVISTKYFNPEIYAYENRNHAARTRDRKRKLYHEFLTWLTEQFNLSNFQFENKDEYLPLIFSTFPNFKKEYDMTIKQYEKDLIFKTKFNGDIVRNVTGLEGKELGEFMASLKNNFNSKQEFKDWIIRIDQDDIINFINKLIKKGE